MDNPLRGKLALQAFDEKNGKWFVCEVADRTDECRIRLEKRTHDKDYSGYKTRIFEMPEYI